MKRILLLFIGLSTISFMGCQKKSIIRIKEPVLDMEFIRIPKGSFQMGDNTDFSHKVNISREFWLGKTEVTQKQWQKIMGKDEIHPEKPSPFRKINPDYPVVSISYFDIELFIEKLNELSDDYSFRLPTEAEWEYACRAGTTTSFSFGELLTDDLASYKASLPSEYSILGRFVRHPQPVASYAPNQWGLYDMHGNVWEWVSDWFAPYPIEETTDPTGPTQGVEKVMRGGSWYFGADFARSYFRGTHEPGLWGFSIGFRLVCEKKINKKNKTS